MAQIGWVYLDNRGGQHRVGLYHGDRSGHVMIHCNLKVVQIDFSVKETRTYSFFIEDELCEVVLEKQPDGRFGYAFEVNKNVDTPRNRERKADERRNTRYLVWFGAGFLGLLLLVFVGLQWYGSEQRKKKMSLNSLFSKLTEENARRLGQEGKTTEAQLLLVQEPQMRKVYYGFVTAEGIRVSGNFQVADTGQVVLPNGLPLADRDAFSARYLPADPQIHRLDFLQPTPNTILEYLRRAADAERRAHPDQSAERSQCVVQTAFGREGWQCLAHFIFQEKTKEQNMRYNRDSYLRLLRDPTLATWIQQDCWNK